MSAKKSVTPEMILKNAKAYKENKKKAVEAMFGTPKEVHSVEEFIKITKELKPGEYVVWKDFVEEKPAEKKDYFEPKNGCPHYKECVSAGLKCYSCRNSREFNGYPTITYPKSYPFGTLV